MAREHSSPAGRAKRRVTEPDCPIYKASVSAARGSAWSMTSANQASATETTASSTVKSRTYIGSKPTEGAADREGGFT